MTDLVHKAATIAPIVLCIGVVAAIGSAAISTDDRTKAIETCTHGTNDQQKCTTEIDAFRSFSGFGYDIITKIERELNGLPQAAASSRNTFRKIGTLDYWAQEECAKWGTNHYNIKCNH